MRITEFFPYILFWEFYSFRFYVQDFNPFWVDFVYGINMGPISFFCLLTSSFPNTICWRNYSFLIVYSWYPCKRSIHHIRMVLCLGSLMWSIGLYVFISLPYCFDYCSFVIYFEIRRCYTSSFLFCFVFPQDCWLFFIFCGSIWII